MANTNNPGAWGIDIGQCALKALRCEMQDGDLVATQVDYIEYPKILSQPDADPQSLIAEALNQFIERHDIEDDKVAVTVPGQSGLAKFFKPPPIELKKLRDIVEFEAKQQIPFDLNEVVWDYQRMGGGIEQEGLLTETEVGLFAMKRDQVIREMLPFDNANITLDAMQLAPMAIYNCITYDLLDNCPDPDVFDPDSPPPSYMVLAIGTETTDMVITNGFRVWHRSIPIGGNHFTRQMTQQLKLTFAKAEHLKRNARDAPNPKRVFQAMRSIYDNLGTEVQRSLRFFQGIDRKATIKGVVITGNTAKLPGLQAFIGKKIDVDVIDMNAFKRLKGSTVTASPTFKNNMLSFANCYGLCLQSLGIAQLQTNLLPREILFDRLVDSKKPWVISAVALLLLSFLFNYFMQYGAWKKVAHDNTGAIPAASGPDSWESKITKAESVSAKSDTNIKDYEALQKAYENLQDFGEQLIGNSDRQVLWIELLKTVNSVLPQEQTTWRDPDQISFSDRPDFYIESIDNAYIEDLNEWWTKVSADHAKGVSFIQKNRKIWIDGIQQNASFIANNKEFVEQMIALETTAAQEIAANAGNTANDGNGGGNSGGPIGGDGAATPVGGGPSDAGWVIQLKGYHFFNNDRETGDISHVHMALLERLRQSIIDLPIAAINDTDTKFTIEQFTMEEMGISHIVLVSSQENGEVIIGDENANATGGGDPGTDMGGMGALGGGGAGAGALGSGATSEPGVSDPNGDTEEAVIYKAKKYSFVVQFCWVPTEPIKRLAAQQLAAQQAQDALDAAQTPVGDPNENLGGDPGDLGLDDNGTPIN
ncbi:MAG: pilus assembly protein PilM [Planctomycetaceae bacterium]|jgi:type IV pilus assembly protein PilM|nr:pilus assembly protein PilM [Planctomycetaceae bacterium]